MVKVEIYTSPFCGFCYAAKRLLSQKGVKFEEHDVAFDAMRKKEMIARSDGRRTVPQLFINSVGIGGHDDLQRLAQNGELDKLLEAG